jgi:hypothetical protein
MGASTSSIFSENTEIYNLFFWNTTLKVTFTTSTTSSSYTT